MRIAIALVLFAAACGNDNPDGKLPDAAIDGRPIDTPPAQPTITISGKAEEMTTSGSSPKQGVVIKAYRAGDDSTVVAMATSNAQGEYSLTLNTNNEALDGYLVATYAGLRDTYLYPPYPVYQDFADAAVFMVSDGNWDNLSTLGGGMQQPGKGLIALIVTDGTNAVAGAMVSSNPASSKTSYNGMAGAYTLPVSNASSTFDDGIAYLYNVPVGGVTVSADKAGSTFASHPVNARADVLTTTIITP
jgi:hypothetical protein